MSAILSIGTAVPAHRTDQKSILAYMQDAYDTRDASRKLGLLFRNSGIDQRFSVVPDFDLQRTSSFYHHGQDVSGRMEMFRQQVLPLSLQAIRTALSDAGASAGDVTHLVTVSCTGMYAPGLDADIMQMLELSPDIYHTGVNFLGCNAAFHAMKMGDMIVRSNPDALVLIVCAELCTLHFQADPRNDHLLSNTIFGDGAAAMLMSSAGNTRYGHPRLTIDHFFGSMLHDGRHLMGWNITPQSFEMVLDAAIPEFLKDKLPSVLGKALRNAGGAAIDHWAIHPGGKRILDAAAEVISAPGALDTCYEVLRNHGNMSSPTILFVLREMLEDPQRRPGRIFAAGFGPGISIETAILSLRA